MTDVKFDPEEVDRARSRNPALTDDAIEKMMENIRGNLESTLANTSDFELGDVHGALRTWQSLVPMRPEPFVQLGEFVRQAAAEQKHRLERRAAIIIPVIVTPEERGHLEAAASAAGIDVRAYLVAAGLDAWLSSLERVPRDPESPGDVTDG